MLNPQIHKQLALEVLQDAPYRRVRDHLTLGELQRELPLLKHGLGVVSKQCWQMRAQPVVQRRLGHDWEVQLPLELTARNGDALRSLSLTVLGPERIGAVEWQVQSCGLLYSIQLTDEHRSAEFIREPNLLLLPCLERSLTFVLRGKLEVLEELRCQVEADLVLFNNFSLANATCESTQGFRLLSETRGIALAPSCAEEFYNAHVRHAE